ncbi:MAG: site-specific integrase, partial [Thaumarchaeota archaeon]|nr:site-specific integrase [Nitrososphaerota archaeon]
PIKSWAEWNEKKITRRIRIANEGETPTIRDEVSPTREELSKLLYAPTTNSRTRVSIALIAFTGCRPEVQGNKNGTEGLQIGDIPDIEVSGDGKHIVFNQIPAQIVVRSLLSKTRKQYFTFLPEEGCAILKQYLEERIASSEILASDSPVISSDEFGRKKVSRSLYNIEDKSTFLATGTVSKHVRKAMRASGLSQRPYVLRSYFDTRLMHGEGLQLVTHSYAQFWMGHKGDIERTYTLNKHKLPPDVMQGIRDTAKRVQKVVQTRVPEEDIVTVEEAKAIGKETWFLSLGFTKEEIQKLDLIHKEGSDLLNSIRQKLQGILTENGRRQKLIKPEEIDSAIEQGYEYVDKLPDGRLIMKLPEF